MNLRNKIFVVGVGRSGTSLLQSMLAAHPQVAYMPETAFLRRYLVSGVLEKIYVRKGLEAVVNHLVEDDVFARTRMEIQPLVLRASRSGKPLEQEIYIQMLEERNSNKRCWIGDKDPRLIEFLPVLKRVFPESHVINVVRDPRDVLLSKKKAAWSKHGHVFKHIFANKIQLNLGRYFGSRLFASNYHEVIYEDLIADPRKVLEQLCQNIGLGFDERMLSFGEVAKSLVSSSEVSWKKETFGPVLSKNSEKWKEQLPSREVYLTELCCKESFDVGKYSISDVASRLSWKDRLWAYFGAAVIYSLDIPYRLYRNSKNKKVCKKN